MAEWKKTPDFRSGRVKKVNFLNEQTDRQTDRLYWICAGERVHGQNRIRKPDMMFV